MIQDPPLGPDQGHGLLLDVPPHALDFGRGHGDRTVGAATARQREQERPRFGKGSLSCCPA
jgi:hypothetical protein